MVSQGLTKELQKIIREEYGIILNDLEAAKVARELSGYFDVLAEINYENTLKSNKSTSQVEKLSSNAKIIKNA